MSDSEKWVATLRIEHAGKMGGGMFRPGSGWLQVLGMETSSGAIWTHEEWTRGVAEDAVQYRRLPDGRILSHGSPLAGYEYGPDENPCEWGRW